MQGIRKTVIIGFKVITFIVSLGNSIVVCLPLDGFSQITLLPDPYTIKNPLL